MSLASLLRARSAAAECAGLMRGKRGLSDCEIGAVLKASARGWVVRARIDGVEAVVKRYRGPEAARIVVALKAELDFLEGVWPDTRFAANRCLHAFPEDGVAVLSFAPGQRLDAAIRERRGADRAALLTQAGAWLAHYCAPRRRHTTFGPMFWVRRMEQATVDAPGSDRAIIEALLQGLRHMARRTRGVPVLQAATHGDFCGINAHLHDGTITGLDIQGECRLAVARDVARFLVWQQMVDPAPPGTRRHGICAEDLTAMLQGGPLPDEEHDTTLPFFIGVALVGRLSEPSHPEADRQRLRAAAAAWLDC